MRKGYAEALKEALRIWDEMGSEERESIQNLFNPFEISLDSMMSKFEKVSSDIIYSEEHPNRAMTEDEFLEGLVSMIEPLYPDTTIQKRPGCTVLRIKCNGRALECMMGRYYRQYCSGRRMSEIAKDITQNI